MPHINYGMVSDISTASGYTDTDTRAYFTGYLTSSNTDRDYRVIPETEHDTIVAQLKAGVRVLDSHKHDTNGIGKTVDAVRDGNRIKVTWYILKGTMGEDGKLIPLKLESQSYQTTMDWIATLKDGMTNKLSMGWYCEQKICNICNCEMDNYRSGCRHYPGEPAKVRDKETNEEKEIIATYRCVGVTVIEMSLVYFASNPDADMEEKARYLAENNYLSEKQVASIETQLNTELIPKDRRNEMPLNEEQQKEINAAVEKAVKEGIGSTVRETITEELAKVKSANSDSYDVVDSTGKVVRTINKEDLPEIAKPVTTADLEKFMNEVTGTIETALKSGETPNDRETAIKACITEYTRLHGKDGNAEEEKAFLETLSDVASINRITENYKKIADNMHGVGRNSEGAMVQVEEEQNGASNDEGKGTNTPM